MKITIIRIRQTKMNCVHVNCVARENMGEKENDE